MHYFFIWIVWLAGKICCNSGLLASWLCWSFPLEQYADNWRLLYSLVSGNWYTFWCIFQLIFMLFPLMYLLIWDLRWVKFQFGPISCFCQIMLYNIDNVIACLTSRNWLRKHKAIHNGRFLIESCSLTVTFIVNKWREC